MKRTDEVVRCLTAALKIADHIENIASLQIFLAVAEQPGVTLTALHERLLLPRSTVSRHVAHLMGLKKGRKGLVQYMPLAEDRRARALRLTSEGGRLVDRMVRVFNRC